MTKGRASEKPRSGAKSRSKGKRAMPVIHHKTRRSKQAAVLALLSRPNSATVAAIVANDPGVLATCRHRGRVRIGERDLLVLALHHLRVDRVEPDNLLLELLDLALQPHNFRLWHRTAVSIRGLKLREIADMRHTE
jgi:hypothetical protein